MPAPNASSMTRNDAMIASPVPELTDADREALARPLLKNLLRIMRSHDRSGAWDETPDAELVAPFIVTKAQKREIPMMGDPDPDILWRVEMLYQAAAWLIEERTGSACAPILNIHHEGWGRIVLIAGRLVAVDSRVRDLHRFGYETVAQLEEKTLKVVEEGVSTITKFPEIAAI
jgi:probable nitrogen fixation protein